MVIRFRMKSSRPPTVFVDLSLLLLALLLYIPRSTCANPINSTDVTTISPRASQKRDRVWNRQIYCIGDMPDYLTQGILSNGRVIEWETPRQLCAKTWYGGAVFESDGQAITANYGGYCARWGRSVKHVFFELSTHNSFNIYSPQSMMHGNRGLHRDVALHDIALTFCQLRCRCISDTYSGASTSSTIEQWPAREISDSEPSDPSKFDKNIVMNTSPGLERSISRHPSAQQRAGKTIYSFDLPEASDLLSRVNVMAHRSNTAWFRPGCVNTLPRRFPAPFSREDFRNSVELCNSPFHGGSEEGSGGFVCIPDLEESGGRRKLNWIAHLSHPSFAPGVSQLGLSIYVWCLSVCKCNLDDEKRQLPVAANMIKEWVDMDLIFVFEEGNVVLKNRDGTNPRGSDSPEILGEEECDVRGGGAKYGQQCHSPDPKSFNLTLIPESLPTLSDILPPLPATGLHRLPQPRLSMTDIANPSTCHRSCTGPRQCGDHCRCVASAPQRLLENAGYGPIQWGVGSRLALCVEAGLVSIFQSRAVKTSVLGLGRNGKRHLDGQEEQGAEGEVRCLCEGNAVASWACCEIEPLRSRDAEEESGA